MRSAGRHAPCIATRIAKTAPNFIYFNIYLLFIIILDSVYSNFANVVRSLMDNICE